MRVMPVVASVVLALILAPLATPLAGADWRGVGAAGWSWADTSWPGWLSTPTCVAPWSAGWGPAWRDERTRWRSRDASCGVLVRSPRYARDCDDADLDAGPPDEPATHTARTPGHWQAVGDGEVWVPDAYTSERDDVVTRSARHDATPAGAAPTQDELDAMSDARDRARAQQRIARQRAARFHQDARDDVLAR